LELGIKVTTRLKAHRHVRILCHVNHFFGSDTAFVGRSTVGDSGTRREVVRETLASLARINAQRNFSVDVRVCGFPERALVPIDTDLSYLDDPRLIVYESICRMFDQIDDFDLFLNIEDDILLTPDVVRSMLDFTQQSRVNEVFLPVRLERNADGTLHAVDQQSLPGWLGMKRNHRGLTLDVANNPHAGMMLLTAPQMRYAKRRIDLERREQFLGGLMASAYANVHQPFLLWRSRSDFAAHHVRHLDTWMWSDAHDAAPSAPSAAEGQHQPSSFVGCIDDVVVDGVVLRLRGWAIHPSGEPMTISALRVGDQEISPVSVTRQDRPDVAAAHSHASLACGFVAAFSTLELAAGWADAAEIELLSNVNGVPVSTAVRGSWPIADVAAGMQAVPHIPDDPFMPETAIARVTKLMADSTCYLEYGTGGTTLLAARQQVPKIIAVESDQNWMFALRHRLAAQGLADAVTMLHVDVGPTGDWGFPIDDSGWRNYHRYALWPWVDLGQSVTPDLVLIDGRFRPACLLATAIHAPAGTRVLFDDYYDRPYYFFVERALKPVARHDRMAEFVVPEDKPVHDLWLLLIEALQDVR
jgi:hypothetical protein